MMPPRENTVACCCIDRSALATATDSLMLSNRKPLVTSFIENDENWKTYRFFTKFNFQPIFWFINQFSTDFLFKIQILNKNDKSVGFLVYRSIFLLFIFSKFLNFFKNVKSNRPIFGEPTESVFIDIVIHDHDHDRLNHSLKVRVHSSRTEQWSPHFLWFP
jgi:hypothetical protein